MANKTVAQLKDSVSGILQGLNLNNVKNLNVAIERTARQVCIKLKIPEATIKQAITLYAGVTDYLAPTNIFETGEIDLRPQGISRPLTDYAYKQPLEQFDREKNWVTSGYKTTFENDTSGVNILRVATAVPVPQIEIDPLNATTGWTAAGNASGLTQDSTVYWKAPASLRFLLTGASIGTLTKSTSSVDLTNYIGVGVLFLAIRTPSATNLTSITIRIGSDSTNYYEVTISTGFVKSFAANEWMLVAFDLSTATTTGSPIITAIDYTQIRITTAGTITNFYVGDLWISLPSPHFLFYQTSAIFLPANSTTPQNFITLDTDSVQLNEAALAIFELETANVIAQQQGGTIAGGVVQQINSELHGNGNRDGLYQFYRADNPSQTLNTTTNYYDD